MQLDVGNKPHRAICTGGLKNQDILVSYVVKWFLNVYFLAPMSRFFVIFSEIALILHTFSHYRAASMSLFNNIHDLHFLLT